MLVRFSVENYRSFKSKSTLSMVPINTSRQNCLKTGCKFTPWLLRGVMLYGANASGKSNLLKAMEVAGSLVKTSDNHKKDSKIAVKPFAFDSACAAAPSTFSVDFILNKTLYHYTFSATATAIVFEKLTAQRPSDITPTLLFERNAAAEVMLSDDKKEQYKTFSDVFKNLTNVLFLSFAQTIPRWFGAEYEFLTQFASQDVRQYNFTTDEYKDRTIALINALDIGVADIESEEKNVREITFDDEKILLRDGNKQRMPTYVVGKNDAGTHARFEFHDEISAGTKALMALAPTFIEIYAQNKLFICDELEAHLHPLIVAALLERFFYDDADATAQFILTTHATDFMQLPYLLRNDQIWLFQKDTDGHSQLYSLADYNTTPSKRAVQYLQGLFAAVPNV